MTDEKDGTVITALRNVKLVLHLPFSLSSPFLLWEEDMDKLT